MTIRILAAAAALVAACLEVGPLLAQNAPASDAAATPAPAASPAPSAPAATPAAPTSPPAAATSTDKTEANEGEAASAEPAKPKSSKRVRISAQTRHEIAHSLKTGTVPSRYRSQVPKEYQKYIPFAR
jgi:hypothetical protein